MHKFSRTLRGMAAVAVIGAVAMAAAAQYARAQAAGSPPAAAEKKAKDQGEADIFNEVIKDVSPPSPNFAKALTDLDTWKQKYPETEYKDERLYYYVQAYNGTKQFGKVVDTVAELMATDLNKTFKDWRQVLQILFNASANVQQIPSPTPEQLAAGDKAAHALVDYDKKPDGMSDADWTTLRSQLQSQGKATMLWLALYPGNLATKNKDCAGAEVAYTKALQDYPDNAAIAYALGGAQICQQKANPEKISQALYEIARAAALDPAKGGDPKIQQTADAYLRKVYTTYHGADEDGLKALKEAALKSPTPPAGFHIESSGEVEAKKQAEFAKSNPQLNMWMGIKAQLAGAGGDQYFQSTLKDADVKAEDGGKALKGTVVEGRPACHSKELLVAISDATHPEVALKLDAALTGKPEAGNVIQWNGVPSAFTSSPFLLTMDTEKTKIDGLKVTPCTAGAAHPPAKKSAAKKK